MRTVNALWGLAISCAILLLFAPLTPRTTWLPTGRNAAGVSSITEGVGWQGIAALIGLGFAIVAVGMTRHWIDLANGITSVHPGEGWALHPAPLVPVFAIVAGAGTRFALALTISWLQPASGRSATFAAG